MAVLMVVLEVVELSDLQKSLMIWRGGWSRCCCFPTFYEHAIKMMQYMHAMLMICFAPPRVIINGNMRLGAKMTMLEQCWCHVVRLQALSF